MDYFLRDLEFLGLATGSEICAAVESLEVTDGIIAVNNPDTARWLAYTFIETDRASWSCFREVGLYQLTAEAIKTATQFGFIEEADLWGSDQALWKKLYSAGHPDVRDLINLITPGTRFTWDAECPLFRVTTKVRSIDPPVTNGKTVTPLSELDAVFGRYRKKYLAGKQGQWPMGIVTAPKMTPHSIAHRCATRVG